MTRSRRRSRSHAFASRRWMVSVLLVLGLALAPSAWADPAPLRILLTNDDGYTSPGIRAMQAALVAAGHDVTIVAPLSEQSGKGGSLNTGVGTFVDVIEQSPGVWSVASSPADAVRAALGAVMAGNPPDLIVSGANFGQNLGQTGSVASGTVNAALQGLHSGIPAIAVSVGIDFSEVRATPIPFPSTFAAFAPASELTARLIRRLQQTAAQGPHGSEILPRRTMLNVNVPVPYGQVKGVRFVRLATRSDFEIVWQDVRGVIPSGGGPVLINVDIAQDRDPIVDSDTNAHRDGYISISTLDGDMTAGVLARLFTQLRLHELAP